MPAPLDALRRPTVLVCDLVQSTVIAEQIGEEALWDLLLEYQDACSEVVRRFDGTVYKRLGDGILALFGAPTAHEDDARRAVHAGLALVAATQRLAVDARRRHGIDLQMRVGIHTGEVIVGFIDGTLEIAGKAVHQADRLQHEANPDGVIVSADTAALVADAFELAEHGMVELRGIAEPVSTFDVIAARDAGPIRDHPVAMVGRTAERALVNDAWEAVREGGSRVIVVTGESGMGKSRFARFARDLAARNGGIPLEARCSPYHRDVPYHVIGRMIRGRLSLEPGATRSERLEALDRLLGVGGIDARQAVPLLAPITGLVLEPDDGYELPERSPAQLASDTEDMVLAWWRAAGALEPRVTVIEDLHNADPSTLALLERILEQGVGPGILLIATARPDAALPPIPEGDLLRLDPLAPDEAAEMVRSVAPDAAHLADDLAARSGGNPLYIRELATAAASGVEQIPSSLRDLLMARLDAAGDLPLAQTLSVLGGAFDPELAGAVSDEPDVAERVENLVATGVLTHQADHRGRRLRFTDELLRETAYESLTGRGRRAIHSRLADLYLGMEDTIDVASLAALHLERAERFDEAVDAHLWSAEVGAARGAFAEALRHLDRVSAIAVTNLEDDRATEVRRVALQRRSFVIVAKEGFGSAAAEAAANEALSLAPEDSFLHTVGPRFTSFSTATILGQRDEAEALLTAMEQDLATAQEADRAQVEAEVVSARALHEFGQAHFTASRLGFERALALYHGSPRHGAPWAQWPLPTVMPATCNAQLVPIYWVQGDRSLADVAGRRALAAAAQAPAPMDAFNGAYAVGYVGWINLLEGSFDAAAEALRRQGEFAAQGFAMWEALSNAFSAVVDANLDPSEASADAMARLRKEAAANAGSSFQPYLLACEADVRRRLGDVAGARDRFDESLALAEATREPLYLAETHRLRAAVVDDTRDSLETAWDLARQQDAHVFALRAAIALAGLEPGLRPDDAEERLQGSLASIAEPDAYPEAGTAKELLTAT